MRLHKGFLRGFSLFVAMLFMLSVFPLVPVFAEEDTIPLVDSALWYTLSDGTLTVGGTGDMPSYGYGKSPFVNNTTITALTFTLPKRTVGAPPKPVIVVNGNSIVVLLEVEGCEYSMDGISWQDSPVFTGISVDPAPVFYQRYKETATTYAGPASSTAEDEPQKIFGDLNDDGDINSDDLTMLACIVARIDEPTEQQLLVGDVTHDGNVNSDDLTKLAQYVARIIDTFD